MRQERRFQHAAIPFVQCSGDIFSSAVPTFAQRRLKYKQLWTVEDISRSMKTLLEMPPVYHKCDETIRGHVRCSFLALLLRKELQDRLDAAQVSLEWADVIRDLEALGNVELAVGGKDYVLRTAARPATARAFAACRVALPLTLKQV